MFTPRHGHVLVRRDDGESQIGSIIVPEIARARPVQGVVESVGPGRHGVNGEIIAPTLAVGDQVLFARDGGTDVETAEGKRLLVGEHNVLAVVLPDGTLRLLLDRVLLDREDEEVMVGSIVIPLKARRPAVHARVVAVGPGRLFPGGVRRPCGVEIGDRVLLQQWSPTIEVHGRKMTIVGELEIFGVLDEQKQAA